MGKKRSNPFKLVLYLILLLVIIFLVYSYFQYKNAVEEEGETFVVCESQDNCILALHMHSEVEIKICGEEIDLPLEAGDRARGTHTHKERNLLHFEERLKYNNITKTITQTEPITLRSFFSYDDINILFSSNCIDGKCNGDLCNGNPGTLKFYVNDQENNKFEKYVWKDGDRIKILFE